MVRCFRTFCIVIALLLLGAFTAFAQIDVSTSHLEGDTLKLHLVDTSSINRPLTDSLTFSNSSAIDSLNTILTEKDATLSLLRHRIDSLNSVIGSRDEEIKRLEAERAFVDTCMARLANRWLYEKYNEEDVNEAINYFNKILSTQLRRDRSVILELLNNYKQAYMSFQAVLVSAQQDSDRTNPFSVPEYKERYISKIELMPYYRRYYNESWNIRYLNEQITTALERLNAHSDEKPADFSDLID